MLDMDTVLIGAATGIVSSILTFMVSRKDANTRANETVTSALTNTIKSLEKHIAHLGGRMTELEKQLELMSDENKRKPLYRGFFIFYHLGIGLSTFTPTVMVSISSRKMPAPSTTNAFPPLT